MSSIFNDILQSPYYFSAFILTVTGLVMILIACWVLKVVKRNHQIESDIKQKNLSDLKLQENYRAQFNDIHAIRQKFKNIKVR